MLAIAVVSRVRNTCSVLYFVFIKEAGVVERPVACFVEMIKVKRKLT